jgi:Ribbon-helix-helix protein, copG family
VKKIGKPTPRKAGRPVTIGAEKFVGLRLPTDLLEAVDNWSKANRASRSEAFRRLAERGLMADAGGATNRAGVQKRGKGK